MSWRCNKRKSIKGTPNLKNSNGVIISSSQHSCQPSSDAKVEVIKDLSNARDRIRESDVSAIKIYAEIMHPLVFEGADVIKEMPTPESFVSNSSRIRRNLSGYVPEAANPGDIVLTDQVSGRDEFFAG
ncbi:hypothetical protein JTE90_013562 [Oedothorax gibbosus]|uniref:Uncharacterized protein n=1 Tax=Oedothorax gibbosus TaxID=931172 RepID=A0AAV6TIS1_9ARAC|nr:hypothetical protein JTE90_013562 [Oedothorax gibbosus]